MRRTSFLVVKSVGSCEKIIKGTYIEVKLYRHNLLGIWGIDDRVRVDKKSPQIQCLYWFADFSFGVDSILLLNF